MNLGGNIVSKICVFIVAVCLCILALGHQDSASAAEQLMFPFPARINTCSTANIMNITNDKLLRVMAYISKDASTNRATFYDLRDECKLDIATEYSSAFKRLVNAEHLKVGQLFKLSTKFSVTVTDNTVLYLQYIYTVTSDAPYEQWRKSFDKETEAAKEKILNSIVYLPPPQFNKRDKMIRVNFEKGALQLENLTADFIEIMSISTYFNNNIKTVSVNMEFPPNSVRDNVMHHTELFSKEMEESCKTTRRGLGALKQGTTKFGFAIKYSSNGKKYTFYSIKSINNRSWLANLK